MEKQKEKKDCAVKGSEGIHAFFQGLHIRSGYVWAAVAILGLLFWNTYAQSDPSSVLERRLATALSQLEGAGEVEVVIYQSEDATDTQGGIVSAFSLLGTQNRRQSTPSGVLILAQGADDMRVRLEIARAVESLLGVPASSIEVLKKAK